MLNTTLHIVTLISVIVGFAFGANRVKGRLDKIKTRLTDAIKMLKGLTQSNNLLVSRLLQEEILTASQFDDIKEPLREIPLDQMSELVREMEPAGNPMTQEEHDRLSEFVDEIARAQKEILKKKEEEEKETYHLNVDIDGLDFYYLARKFKEEYKEEEPETEEDKRLNELMEALVRLATFFAYRHPSLSSDEYVERFNNLMESTAAIPEKSEE